MAAYKVLLMLLVAVSMYEMATASTYIIVETLNVWDAARTKCEAQGGHLLTIGSEEEQETVTEWVQTSLALNPHLATTCVSSGWAAFGTVFFTGARRATDSCTAAMAWFGHGGALTEVKYTNWSAGEPDCARNVQFCGVLSVGYKYKWADHECGAAFCAICEFNM